MGALLPSSFSTVVSVFVAIGLAPFVVAEVMVSAFHTIKPLVDTFTILLRYSSKPRRDRKGKSTHLSDGVSSGRTATNTRNLRGFASSRFATSKTAFVFDWLESRHHPVRVLRYAV